MCVRTGIAVLPHSHVPHGSYVPLCLPMHFRAAQTCAASTEVVAWIPGAVFPLVSVEPALATCGTSSLPMKLLLVQGSGGGHGRRYLIAALCSFRTPWLCLTEECSCSSPDGHTTPGASGLPGQLYAGWAHQSILPCSSSIRKGVIRNTTGSTDQVPTGLVM